MEAQNLEKLREARERDNDLGRIMSLGNYVFEAIKSLEEAFESSKGRVEAIRSASSTLSRAAKLAEETADHFDKYK